jgi:hypothetical protein
VIIVGEEACGWNDGFWDTGLTAVDTFEGKIRIETPPWGRGVSFDEHAKML